MYTSFDFDPSDVLLPEAQRYADDDFILEWEEKRAQRRLASQNYDEYYFDMLHEDDEE